MTEYKNTGSNNNFMAVVYGTLVGFAAGAATVVLMDEKKRQQVVKISRKVLKDIKDKATNVSDTVEEKYEENKKLLSDKLKKTAKNLKET